MMVFGIMPLSVKRFVVLLCARYFFSLKAAVPVTEPHRADRFRFAVDNDKSHLAKRLN